MAVPNKESEDKTHQYNFDERSADSARKLARDEFGRLHDSEEDYQSEQNTFNDRLFQFARSNQEHITEIIEFESRVIIIIEIPGASIDNLKIISGNDHVQIQTRRHSKTIIDDIYFSPCLLLDIKNIKLVNGILELVFTRSKGR